MNPWSYEAAEGRRIAFFGGSFDPPHCGHLAVARAARNALGLDQVLFAPVGTQPLKPHGPTASFDERLAMTRLAIAGEAGFAISLADAPAPQGTANYSIDTLMRLRSELPRADKLFCLMGADSFLGLRHWHRGAEIPFVAPLIVASRPGQSLEDLAAALPAGLSIASNPSDYVQKRRRRGEPLHAAQPRWRTLRPSIFCRGCMSRSAHPRFAARLEPPEDAWRPVTSFCRMPSQSTSPHMAFISRRPSLAPA